MAIEQFEATGEDGTMFGLTFDLDVKTLEEDFGINRQSAYQAIDKKLAECGFTHVQYSVYFCEDSKGATAFTLKVLDIFKVFKFAAAINRFHIFEVHEWAEMAQTINEYAGDSAKLGRSLWP